MSPVPAFEFVNPQAIRPVLPATSAGVPGSVTPVSSWPGHLSDIRYQMFGTPRCRCMSLATIAGPPAARAPGDREVVRARASRRSPQTGSRRGPARAVARPPRLARCAGRPRRRAGSAPAAHALPSRGASCGCCEGREERERRRAELVADRRERADVAPRAVLQVERHRVGDEDAVLGQPGPGLRAQDEVLPGLRAEGREARVHALRHRPRGGPAAPGSPAPGPRARAAGIRASAPPCPGAAPPARRARPARPRPGA